MTTRSSGGASPRSSTAPTGLTVVAEAGSVAEAVRRGELVRPDVLLVDLQLPDGTGIDIISTLREKIPDARSVVLTSFDDDDALAAALKAGAKRLPPQDGARRGDRRGRQGRRRRPHPARRAHRHPPARRPRRPDGGPHALRAQGPRPHRRRDVQPGDRREARRRREDGEEPHHRAAEQDGPAAAHPGRGLGRRPARHRLAPATGGTARPARRRGGRRQSSGTCQLMQAALAALVGAQGEASRRGGGPGRRGWTGPSCG